MIILGLIGKPAVDFLLLLIDVFFAISLGVTAEALRTNNQPFSFSENYG